MRALRKDFAVVLGATALLSSGCAGLDRGAQGLKAGESTRAEVIRQLGPPDEVRGDDSVQVWIYTDVLEVPPLLGFVPVVGDVLDLVVAANELRGSHELIVQIDPKGVVRRLRLRQLGPLADGSSGGLPSPPNVAQQGGK
ncbi:MAG: hypothetical protein KDG55_01585 [Rhodocyclaceae bacterium]|nr:hypothetical protein [Rhodocyclaceae bacterium]